ncbi:hypothetical protein H7F15_11910 [Pontibacter sp. Tf4]|uniref:hypothetical protein n=1 Tax=Pontibacter sp. Tf4 TaxID=2761620 RepID=UPI001628C3BB|nr:hypothetical protein [Pontibacter sp. Tf4]MBB6611746.1 hypothetical protein [Pontibacter sp. Tf4]
MKKPLLLLSLSVALLTGCNTGPTEAEQKAQLEQHVMAVHDSAMADMGQIFKLRKNLRTLRDTLATQQTDTTVLLQLQENITSLSKADEAMMDWMRNYKAPDSLQHQQAMDYLNQELQKIEKVKTTMDSSINAARQVYQQHEL